MSANATIERLWKSLASGLLAWFHARGATADEADDLLSETFLRVQRSLASVRDEERYDAWVRRIARHVLIDSRRGARPDDLTDDGDVVAADDTADLNTVVASWIEPTLAELDDPLTVEILRRTELAGERQADVASDLGLGLGAVKARVRRGRAKLRERLEACCAFEFDRRGGVIEARRRAGDCKCD